MSLFDEKIWDGPSQIVVALDIGVITSEVSYAYLQPGCRFNLYRVAQWAGQEAQNSHGLVPTMLCYDSDGRMVVAGAEVLTPEGEEQSKANAWTRVTGFPQHLYPSSPASHLGEAQSLPHGVSLLTVYSDFIKYLLDHSHSYFCDHIIDGRVIAKRFWDTMTVVFAVPAAWSIEQYELIRQAFSRARPEFKGSIEFVELGEAFIYGTTVDAFGSIFQPPSTNVILCNSSHDRTEITTYRPVGISSTLPRFVQSLSRIIDAGPSHVKEGLRQHLTQLFASSDLTRDDSEDFVMQGLKDFEVYAMRVYKSPEMDYSIGIAGSRYNHAGLGVKRGRMTLGGHVLEGLFDPPIAKIAREIDRQKHALGNHPITILLVGELADSPYLREALVRGVNGASSQVLESREKVRSSHGALLLSAYNKRMHLAFSSVLSLGILIGERYDESNPDHLGRNIRRGHGGFDIVGNKWSEIAKLSDLTGTDSCIRHKIVRSLRSSQKTTSGLERVKYDIWAFEGGSESGIINTGWAKDRNGETNPGFRKLCHLEADLSDWKGTLVRKYSNTKPKLALEIFLVIRFDGLHLSANIEWEEGELIRGGPSSKFG